MKALANKNVKVEKDQKMQSVMNILNDLKIDSINVNEITDKSQIDEIMKIKDFNGSLEEISKELQTAYSCLFQGINN